MLEQLRYKILKTIIAATIFNKIPKTLLKIMG